MHFTKTLLASGIPLLAVCNRLKLKPRTISPPFHLLAIHSTSPVHLQPINARLGGFYIGERPETYCPQAPCPVVNQTGFIVANGKSFLDVSVAGGQNLYVNPHGALSFTRAGSPGAIPAGAATANFTYTPAIDDDDGPGSFMFSGPGADGFLACPSDGPTGIPYSVFANVTGLTDATVPGGNVSACVGIAAAAFAYTYEDNVVAYGYD